MRIAEDRPRGIDRTRKRGTHCSFVGRALSGDTFYAENSDVTCPLAQYNLGLVDPGKVNLGNLARILVGWGDAVNVSTGIRYLKGRPRQRYGKKYIIYFPIPRQDIVPDVTIVMGTPYELMYLVREMTCAAGENLDCAVGGVGAMCGECTAVPMVTGRPNVSLGCTGCRPSLGLGSERLLLAIPADRGDEMVEQARSPRPRQSDRVP